MTRFSHFIKTSVIGGLLVISPITILYIAFRWAFLSLSEFIEPLTTPITDRSSAPDLAVDALVIALLLFGCCVVGTAVTTGAGKWLTALLQRWHQAIIWSKTFCISFLVTATALRCAQPGRGRLGQTVWRQRGDYCHRHCH